MNIFDTITYLLGCAVIIIGSIVALSYVILTIFQFKELKLWIQCVYMLILGMVLGFLISLGFK
jgi:hypothetical protein